MHIVICGSLSMAEKIKEVASVLQGFGHSVEIPLGVQIGLSYADTVPESEKVGAKLENNVIKRYYDKIAEADAILVVNEEKKGIPGYIGGNTFLEMGFAHVLGKGLYCLNPIPDMSYTSEMLAMNPTVLNGDLEPLHK